MGRLWSVAFISLGIAFGMVTVLAISRLTGDDNDIAEVIRQPEAISCAIDEVTEPGSRVSVPLIVVEGNQEIPDVSVAYRGTTAKVILNTGDGFEPQSFFSMTIDDDDGGSANSTMYDYRLVDQVGPINIVNYDNGVDSLRLQCWME